MFVKNSLSGRQQRNLISQPRRCGFDLAAISFKKVKPRNVHKLDDACMGKRLPQLAFGLLVDACVRAAVFRHSFRESDALRVLVDKNVAQNRKDDSDNQPGNRISDNLRPIDHSHPQCVPHLVHLRARYRANAGGERPRIMRSRGRRP